jgi:murein DD-endopeptidase MepM/ murein hydrolase activator NlpD
VAHSRSSRAIRLAIAVVFLAAAAVPILATSATGVETLTELQDQLDALRSDLLATNQRVEDLHALEHEVERRIGEIDARIGQLTKETARLQKAAVARADALYRSGSTGVFEALFGSEDLSELATKTEMLSQVQMGDTEVFVRLSRSKSELEDLSEEMADREIELEQTKKDLLEEAALLREKLRGIADEYAELKRQQAEAARQREAQAATQVAPASSGTVSVPVSTPSGPHVCPVAGPNSFIDSWGYPRSGGRSHEGTDIMADYGVPVVAIVSGTITLSSYGPSAGNWQILSGDNGNEYWYMHNRRNLVNGGHVQQGQQIAEVGDTGNATGIPHLHFEYHPGGGGPVNPYPLVAPIC